MRLSAPSDGVASGGWTAAVAHATDTSEGNCSVAVLVDVEDNDLNRQGMEGAAGRAGYSLLAPGAVLVGEAFRVDWMAPADHGPEDVLELWRARPGRAGAGGADLKMQRVVGAVGKARSLQLFKVSVPGVYKVFYRIALDGSYAAYSEEFTAVGTVHPVFAGGQQRPSGAPSYV